MHNFDTKINLKSPKRGVTTQTIHQLMPKNQKKTIGALLKFVFSVGVFPTSSAQVDRHDATSQ